MQRVEGVSGVSRFDHANKGCGLARLTCWLVDTLVWVFCIVGPRKAEAGGESVRLNVCAMSFGISYSSALQNKLDVFFCSRKISIREKK